MSITLIPSTYEYSEFNPGWKNFRAYTFTFLIYTEWSWYEECIRRIQSFECKFFAISPLHDSDVDENGVLCKPHFHCIVRFQNARSSYQVCKDFLLTCAVQKVDDFSGLCRYLVHNDNPEKYSYNIQDVLTNNFSLFENQFHDDLSDEVSFLQEVESKILRLEFRTELEIALWCLSQGYGRFFPKYKYQIHADFVSTKLADLNKQKNEY